jgi:hypothetical protein
MESNWPIMAGKLGRMDGWMDGTGSRFVPMICFKGELFIVIIFNIEYVVNTPAMFSFQILKNSYIRN